MKVLIKDAKIIDANSPFDQQTTDLLIENGRITLIGENLIAQADTKVIEADGLCISPGWMDMGVHGGDPGFEHREDSETLNAAAQAGGFTAIACYPNTSPIRSSKTAVRYLIQQTQHLLVDFYPLGAISEDCKGVDITEMYDMHTAGAIGFTDGKYPVQHAGLMMRALLYTKAFDGLIINQSYDDSIAPGWQMHEGLQSTRLGLKGTPAIAEEMAIERDIRLAEYTDSKLHLANISTVGSVELVRAAKSKGIKVTASVAAINLHKDDSALNGFDTNLKVFPPLRTPQDIEALKQGLIDGTIDVISSNHTPLEEEAKRVEFPYAKCGSIGLETVFSLAYAALKDDLSISQIIDKISTNPRQITGLKQPTIQEGNTANITVFDPNATWTPTLFNIASRSKNTAIINEELPGKVIGVINGVASTL